MKLYKEQGGCGVVDDDHFSSKGTPLNQDFSHLDEHERALRKQAMVDDINSREWSYFITLTFVHGIKDEVEVGVIFGKFVSQLSASVYGRRSKKRVRVAAVLERFESKAIHIHFLMEDVVSRISDTEKARDFNVRHEVIKAWKSCHYKTSSPLRATSKNDMWFQEVYDGQGLIDYIAKDVRRGSNPFLSQEFSFEGRRFK